MRRLSLTVIAAFVVALSGLFTGTAFADGGCPSDMPCNSPNTVPPDPGGYSGAAAAAYADKYASRKPRLPGPECQQRRRRLHQLRLPGHAGRRLGNEGHRHANRRRAGQPIRTSSDNG